MIGKCSSEILDESLPVPHEAPNVKLVIEYACSPASIAMYGVVIPEPVCAVCSAATAYVC